MMGNPSPTLVWGLTRVTGWVELPRKGCSRVARLAPSFRARGHPCSVHRKLRSHFHHVNGKPRVLADEHVVPVGNLHVGLDDIEHFLGGRIGFLLVGLLQGRAHIGRQDLQSSDVKLLAVSSTSR